jgi:hypothetical protein
MADLDIPIRRWTRVEYERLVECGSFQPGDRVEGKDVRHRRRSHAWWVCLVGQRDLLTLTTWADGASASATPRRR